MVTQSVIFTALHTTLQPHLQAFISVEILSILCFNVYSDIAIMCMWLYTGFKYYTVEASSLDKFVDIIN